MLLCRSCCFNLNVNVFNQTTTVTVHFFLKFTTRIKKILCSVIILSVSILIPFYRRFFFRLTFLQSFFK